MFSYLCGFVAHSHDLWDVARLKELQMRGWVVVWDLEFEFVVGLEALELRLEVVYGEMSWVVVWECEGV